MAISRLYNFIDGQQPTAAQWNAELNNILNNATSLVSPFTAALDLNGNSLVLDAAATTTITSSTSQAFNCSIGAKQGTPGLSAGSILNFPTHTFTDINTAASGTAPAYAAITVGVPTLAAANTSVTTTDAATLYIGGPPASGLNEAVLNTWALWVDAGSCRFDGILRMANSIAVTALNNAGTGAVNLIHLNTSDQVILGQAASRVYGAATSTSRFHIPVVATASLPAAGGSEDGSILIEDNGVGDRNLIIYGGGQRFRIDGGAAF